MNLQLAIIDLLRGTPKPVLRLLSGKPSRIDGRTLDLNMHMMAKLAARGASSTRGVRADQWRVATGVGNDNQECDIQESDRKSADTPAKLCCS